jgi:hypothetical protein
VFLSADSLKDDCILLLDSFFGVLIWHGRTIVNWKNSGYQDLEEYSNFRALLEVWFFSLSIYCLIPLLFNFIFTCFVQF